MAISRLDMDRQLRNMGGIMSLDQPRQGYFLGKLVKKAKKAVKKVVKSPIGKAAILAGGAGLLGGVGPFAGLRTTGLGKFLMGDKLASGFMGPISKGKTGILQKFFLKDPRGGFSLGNLLGKGLTDKGLAAGIGGLSGLAGLLAAGEQDEDEIDIESLSRGEGLDIADIIKRARMNDPEFRFLPGAEFTGAYKKGGDVKPGKMGNPAMMQEIEDMREFMIMNPNIEDVQDYKPKKKRKKKADGGIMNLGGMEMDLRGGGFVPLGAKEKADDVPARLSKNEFVMTADAVRAAGGGSVDKGADKMYKLMKNLEARV